MTRPAVSVAGLLECVPSASAARQIRANVTRVPVVSTRFIPRAGSYPGGSEVQVASGCLAGIDVGWGFEPCHAGVHGDGPAFFVDDVVMVAAQQGAVVGSGGAAVGPVVDVVGFAPRRGDSAIGEGAALVAGGDGFADVGREHPGGAADVQDAAVAAEQDGDDVRVAGDLADDRGMDRTLERGRTGAQAGACGSGGWCSTRSSRSR